MPARSVPKRMLEGSAVFIANVGKSLFVKKQRAAESDPGAALENGIDSLDIPAGAFALGKLYRPARGRSVLHHVLVKANFWFALRVQHQGVAHPCRGCRSRSDSRLRLP